MPEQPKRPERRDSNDDVTRRGQQPVSPNRPRNEPTRVNIPPVSGVGDARSRNESRSGRRSQPASEASPEEKPLNADYWYGVPNAPYQEKDTTEKQAMWRVDFFRMFNEGCSVHIVAFTLANLVSCALLGVASYSSFGLIQSPNAGTTGMFIGTTILWTLFTNQMRVLLATSGENGAALVRGIIETLQNVVSIPYTPGQEEALITRLFSAGLAFAGNLLNVQYSAANEQRVASVLLQPTWLFVLLGAFFILVLVVAALRAFRGPRPRWVYFLGMTFGFWAVLTMACYGITLAAAMFMTRG